jgi:hypothetical protein
MAVDWFFWLVLVITGIFLLGVAQIFVSTLRVRVTPGLNTTRINAKLIAFYRYPAFAGKAGLQIDSSLFDFEEGIKYVQKFNAGYFTAKPRDGMLRYSPVILTVIDGEERFIIADSDYKPLFLRREHVGKYFRGFYRRDTDSFILRKGAGKC